MSSSVLLDQQLCFPLYAASRALTRLYRDLLSHVDLTYPQYLVLMVLWEEREIPMATLGERLDLDSGTLTPLLKRLEQRELLARTRDADDERRVLVTLLQAGAALEGEAAAVSDGVRRATGLDNAEIATLKGLMEQMLASVNEARAD